MALWFKKQVAMLWLGRMCAVESVIMLEVGRGRNILGSDVIEEL